MKVKIYPPNVPKEFLDFVQMVSIKEGLDDWTLTIWKLKGEAECINDMKRICMAIRSGYDEKRVIEEMSAWFLHEVAHATFEMGGGKAKDSLCHEKGWRKELERLLNCHMPYISERTSLWLKGLE